MIMQMHKDDPSSSSKLFTAQHEQGDATKRCNLLSSPKVLLITKRIRLSFKMWEVIQL